MRERKAAAMAGQPESGRRAAGATELRLVSDDRYQGWESVYRDNVDWVYGLMYAKVGNRPDAEDLTAEVFTTALPPLRLDASVPEIRAYLRATARTTLAAHWRNRLGYQLTSIDPETQAEVDEPVAPDRAVQRRAEALLQQLPPRYRSILQLRFLQGLSVRDAATELGVTVANAKVLQHRALQLAARVGRQEVDDRE